MSLTNKRILQKRENKAEHVNVKPQDIFDFVTGTSTGGLIAIMLGKLEMGVDQCIAAYKTFAARVFARKHIRGWVTRGLAQPRYSGKCMTDCVKRLMRDRGFNEAMPMVAPDDRTAW